MALCHPGAFLSLWSRNIGSAWPELYPRVAIEAFKEAKVNLVTLTNYEAVLEAALKTGYINEEDVPVLDAWRKDPAHWDAGK